LFYENGEGFLQHCNFLAVSSLVADGIQYTLKLFVCLKLIFVLEEISPFL